MNVKDIMIENVNVCRPDDNLAEVVATMWNARCGSLPVLNSQGAVTGMITDRDICIALGTRNRRAAELRVEDVSLPRVFTCASADNVRSALNTMATQNVRRLPVVDNADKLVGILSIDDLLLHSEPQAGESGISCRDVVDAAKSILKDRFRRRTHEPAELVALEHAAS